MFQNTNLSKYQRGVYYSGIKLFSELPPNIKILNHYMTMLRSALKDLLSHSYFVEEFTSTSSSQLAYTDVSNNGADFLL
jgi:hypothetical protein